MINSGFKGTSTLRAGTAAKLLYVASQLKDQAVPRQMLMFEDFLRRK